MRRKKPAGKAARAAKTPHSSAKKPRAAKMPATDLKTPAQLRAGKPPQPRSSAQAKAAASAMHKALDGADTATPGVRETTAGEAQA